MCQQVSKMLTFSDTRDNNHKQLVNQPELEILTNYRFVVTQQAVAYYLLQYWQTSWKQHFTAMFKYHVVGTFTQQDLRCALETAFHGSDKSSVPLTVRRVDVPLRNVYPAKKKLQSIIYFLLVTWFPFTYTGQPMKYCPVFIICQTKVCFMIIQ